jgi:hypothetical protein
MLSLAAMLADARMPARPAGLSVWARSNLKDDGNDPRPAGPPGSGARDRADAIGRRSLKQRGQLASERALEIGYDAAAGVTGGSPTGPPCVKRTCERQPATAVYSVSTEESWKWWS